MTEDNRDYYEISENDEVMPRDFEDKMFLEAYYKRIGERIRKAREETGYTLQKVAGNLGVTPSAIANYESGIRQIPVHILLELAKILGKPLQYFLGPDAETPLLLTLSLKSAVERYTEASYIDSFFELIDGKLVPLERPEPMIPVPPDIAKNHQFALRQYNEKTGTYNYLICKHYFSQPKKKGIIFKKVTEQFIPPAPDDWVIAEVGDTGKKEIVQFKNVTPSPGWGEKQYVINVRALVLARIERLVK